MTPDGVQVLRKVNINGISQWISIRGRNRNNPVLLFIHGGPGSPEMPRAWAFRSDDALFHYLHRRQLLKNGEVIREKTWQEEVPRDFQ